MSGSSIVFRWWFLQHPWPELLAAFFLPHFYIAFQRLRHRRQNELFRLVSENAADMIALVEVSGKRLYNSPAYERVLGYSRRNWLQPHRSSRFIPKTAPWSSMRHKDGSWRTLESTANLIRDRKGIVTQLVIVNRDITERKRIQEQLEHNAFHDTLTNLPNRSLFLDRLQLAAVQARRHPEYKFAVLFVDVQGLKIFNETMGHAVVHQFIIDIRRLRWWRNDSELVAPADFIEVAEETGLIVPLGRWILNETCRQAHQWHMQFNTDPLLTATVNVSPRQFAQSNIVADVKSALDESGLNPWSLQLEITESVAMSDPLKAARIFSELKDLGVRLSIDDFGTGHSSLSRLRGFPVDVLKIDRSFISAIEHDCDSRDIARLIITLAHHLNLKVIAEGIETLGQRSYLQEFGCEFGQGYLFSVPVGHAVIENMLATQVSDEVKDPVFAGSPLAAPSQIEALLHSGR